MAIGDKQINLYDLKAVYDNENNMIAPTEQSSAASLEHSVGNHFIFNGKLYTATNDIAVGDEIVVSGVSSNCEIVVDGLGGEVSDIITPDSLVKTSQINYSIFHENKPDPTATDPRGYAIGTADNTYGQVVRLNYAETSNKYPCKAGDTIKLTVYTNAVRGIIATYNANGDTLNVVLSDPSADSVSNYTTYSYTFQEGETAFRVSHSLVQSGNDNPQSIVYIPAYMGNGTMVKVLPYEGFPMDGIITPAMFGAVGDGVTDDADAIQSMFDFAYYTGRRIQFPKDKIHYISHGIMLRAYTDQRGYYVDGQNGTINENIRFDKSYDAVFYGESYPVNASTTDVNMILKNFSARAYDFRIDQNTTERKSSFAKRITFTNESMFDNCKIYGFDVVFEASTVAVGSKLKNSTFIQFHTAFMTDRHRRAGDPFGDDIPPIQWFTRGANIGFFSDSQMTNCYISGRRQKMPPVFIGTHMDTDALISGCFFEFSRIVFAGGYINTTNSAWNGGFFVDCIFQYFCRLADCGLTKVRFVNTYFTSFSWTKLSNHSNISEWPGLSDWSDRKIGVICTDEDNAGNNTEKFTYNLRFYNCALSNCDRFIDLNGLGQTSTMQFNNSVIIEKDTEYNDSDHVLETRVHFAGKFSPDCWSDTLNFIDRASDAPATDSNGNIIDSFKGQQVVTNNSIRIAVVSNNVLVYMGGS